MREQAPSCSPTAGVISVILKRPLSQCAGFTLVEMIVVLMIFGVLAVLFAPKPVNETLIVAAQADRLMADIRYAQSLAMTRGQRHRINFTPGASPVLYQFTLTSGSAVMHPVAGSTPVAMEAGVEASLINLPGNLIGFDGQGTPYIDAVVTSPLASIATIRLTLNGISQDITISPETGAVQ